MTKHILLLLFLFVICSLNSQEQFHSNKVLKKHLTYKELAQNGVDRKVFQLIGHTNNIDVRKVYLDIKYQLLTNLIQGPDNKFVARISTSKVSLDGNINLRDFAIDSLLWPTEYSASLVIKNGRHIRDEILLENLDFNTTIEVDISEYLVSNIGEIGISIRDVNLSYNNASLYRLEKISETIKYYYSYGSLLDDIIVEYTSHSVKNAPISASIFTQKLELDRINSYLENHNFNEKLNLRNRDPIRFIKLKNKFNRLVKRANTLFSNEILQKKNTNINSSIFCEQFFKLSIKYLSKTNLMQPAEALSFEEVARINNSLETKQNIELISRYYGEGLLNKQLETPQCIFNYFVNSSGKYLSNDDYYGALVTIHNSKLLSTWFNIKLTPDYCFSVHETINGIASSYLRVGKMALLANNLTLADQYISKADEVITVNANLLDDVVQHDSSFNAFVGLQNNIAIIYMKANLYNKAMLSLSSAKRVCIQHKASSYVCQKLDSTICELHYNYVDWRLDKVEKLIGDFQYPDAFDMLISIGDYKTKNSCSDTNKRFEKVANSLYLEFRKQGEILIDAKQSHMALEKLFKAHTILKISNGDIDALDSIIKKAAEPEIIRIIDQASYHTWANRMDKARLLEEEAIQMNTKYFNGRNTVLNKALADLENTMEMRKCRDYQNGYSDAIKKAEILIGREQFDELNTALEQAKMYVSTYPECNIDNSELKKLELKYQSILQFYSMYNLIGEKLYEKGYKEAIKLYIELMNYYTSKDLVQYNITFISLENFILKQKLQDLTFETATYYLEGVNPELSLLYLKIFDDQGGDPKKSKKLLLIVAKKLAKKDDAIGIPINEALGKYEYNNSWFGTFRVAYLKNRVIK